MSTIIALTDILVPEERQRELFPEQQLQELRDSILTEKGLMNPILVRPDPHCQGHYILVAGERRFRAIRGIERDYMHGNNVVPRGYIPAVVKDFSNDIEVKEAELHENIIRMDLSWQEKAKAIADLHQLKQLRDPRHSAGMTAHLIDEGSEMQQRGYYSRAAMEKVQNSLLVKDYLNDPLVAKAGSLKEATKVVTRKLEEDNLKRLRALQQQRQAEVARIAAEEAAQPKDRAPRDTPAAGPGELDILADLAKTEHKFLFGDMRERIKEIDPGSVHVVVTDPPYGAGVEGFHDSGNSALAHEYSEADFIELHSVFIRELDRICAASAHVYIFCDPFVWVPQKIVINDETYEIPEGMWWATLTKMFSPSWRIRPKPLIWHKGHTGNLADGSAQGYKRSHEYILYASRGGRPCSALIGDVISVPMVRDKVHAAQKPVALYEKLLEMSAAPGDTVLDAFAGSGTIFQAARTKLVRAIGIEQSEKFAGYCEQVLRGEKPYDEEGF